MRVAARRRVSVRSGASVLVVGVLASSVPAHACLPGGSPPCAGADGVGLEPLDGATDVPTNVEIGVSWVIPSATYPPPLRSSTTARLRAPDGTTIALTRATRTARLLPVSALEPSTSYVVEDLDFGTTCDPAPDVFVELGTFTTGAGPDTLPPERPSAPLLDECFHFVCLEGCSCRDHWWQSLTHILPPDPEPEPGLRYEMWVDGTLFRTSTGETAFFGSEWRDTSYSLPLYAMLPLRAGAISVVAIDPAGNVSEESLAVEFAGCAPPPEVGSDAGSTPSSDAGGAARLDGGLRSDVDVGGTGHPPRRSACAVGGRSRAPAPLATATLVVVSLASATAWRARRRERACRK